MEMVEDGERTFQGGEGQTWRQMSREQEVGFGTRRYAGFQS